MNKATNLPEPTYNVQKLFVGFKNAIQFLKGMALLTKKLFML